MNPEVVAAIIAASVSVLTLVGTLATQYLGRRATSRDTQEALEGQRKQLERTLEEQGKLSGVPRLPDRGPAPDAAKVPDTRGVPILLAIVRRITQPLAAYLLALPQTLTAYSGVTRRRHGGDLVAAQAAEIAPFGTGLIVHLLDERDGCAGGPTGNRQHLMDAVDAYVADEDTRPGDQGFHLI
jgi:hypothetical protein